MKDIPAEVASQDDARGAGEVTMFEKFIPTQLECLTTVIVEQSRAATRKFCWAHSEIWRQRTTRDGTAENACGHAF